MMDIFFQDPTEVPLPPEEVRIRQFRAEPWGDGRRVRIYLEVDPFQKRPCAEIVVDNSAGDEVALASIIETITRKMEINLHLRETHPQGNYIAKATLFYSQFPDENGVEEEKAGSGERQQDRMVVDRSSITFDISISTG